MDIEDTNSIGCKWYRNRRARDIVWHNEYPREGLWESIWSKESRIKWCVSRLIKHQNKCKQCQAILYQDLLDRALFN